MTTTDWSGEQTQGHKKRPHGAALLNLYVVLSSVRPLHRKTLSTAAGSCGVGVVERKTLALQTARELHGRVKKVQKAFQVGDNFNPIVFEYLV